MAENDNKSSVTDEGRGVFAIAEIAHINQIRYVESLNKWVPLRNQIEGYL